jgi:hypothetical protein
MVLICAMVGAVGAQAPIAQTRGKPTRHVAPGEWQEIRKIGLDTDLFDQPGLMVATQDRIVVADGTTIKSLRLSGDLEWKAGRSGSGPGEYRAIVDLAIDSAGNVLVYDEGLHRLTVVDRAGKTRRVVSLPNRTDRAVFSTPSAYLLLNTESDTIAAIVDTVGTALRRLVRMPPDLRPVPGLAREMTSVLPGHDGYLVVFRWASRMQLIDRSGNLRSSCSGVDSLSFPSILETKLKDVAGMSNVRAHRIDPKAQQAAVGATLFHSRIAVVAAASKGKPRLIDLYALPCGPYIESRPFPFPFVALAGNQSLMFAMLSDPVPHIVVLRWNPR